LRPLTKWGRRKKTQNRKKISTGRNRWKKGGRYHLEKAKKGKEKERDGWKEENSGKGKKRTSRLATTRPIFPGHTTRTATEGRSGRDKVIDREKGPKKKKRRTPLGARIELRRSEATGEIKRKKV